MNTTSCLIDDLKYKHFVDDMDAHFSHANVTDFDIIYHPCCADPLQNSQAYYETIFNSDRKFSAEDIECIAECFNE